MANGNSSALLASDQSSRNSRLAVLTVLSHLAEYATYVGYHDSGGEENWNGESDAHTKNLESLRAGGIQGLCVGLLSASALACARNLTEAAELGAVAVRLALCTAAFVDLDQMDSVDPAVCISARWLRSMNDGSGSPGETCYQPFKEMLDIYQKAYIGVRMDIASATITAPKSDATSLMRHLEEKGAMAKEIDLKGRFHYSGHTNALQTLIQLCDSTPMLQFPQERRPLVPLRQNINGEVVTDEGPLHKTVLRSILTDMADWYTTMSRAVSAVTETLGSKSERVENSPQRLVQLGPVECIPRSVLAGTSIKVLQPTAHGTTRCGYPEDAVAVIGLSCRFPDAETPEKFWDTILRGKKTGDSLLDADSFDCGLFRKSPREAEYMDPQQRLALHLAYEALESAGYFSPSSSWTDNIGCYLGMSSCDYEDHVNARPPSAFSFTGTARSFAGGRISHFFGLTGPSMVIDTACSSSGVAINTAYKAVQSGDCAMALAGGVNLTTAEGRAHQNLAGASFLSPTGQCRPFDTAADGYRRGQGGGFVLLKRLSAAVADNDRILGVLAASAVNNSKGSRSITLPSSESQSTLYRNVLRLANLDPRDVSYVEAHGTGTQKGDPVECQSIRSVFGKDKRAGSPAIRFGSIKGNFGHGEAASGIASLTKVLLMLEHRLITPQANFSVLNPAIPSLEEDNMEISVETVPWNEPYRVALVNNYGASGANAAMVVCQPPMRPHRVISTSPIAHRFPIILAANTAVALIRCGRALSHFIENYPGGFGDEHLPSFAFHLAQRQNHSLAHRTMFSVASAAELRAHLETLVQRSDKNGNTEATQNTKSGPKPVVLLFSGQTGRRAHLNRDAYLGFSLLRRHLDRCNRTLQALGLHSLFPRIFDTEPVEDLVDLHCMQFALQYSVATAWIDAGLKIKTMVGHSLGQLTALCVSGVISLQDALKMVSGRASLIQTKWSTERGRMLSVDADAATVQNIAQSAPEGDKVEIACYNAPLHQVVAGTETAISAFEQAATSKGVSTRRLAVTHAFHSKLVDDILPEYYRLLRELNFRPVDIPIEPCSESAGSWDTVTPQLVGRQSREPVYFVDALSRVEQRLGSCVWLEVGSGSAAITMARRALESQSSRRKLSHTFYAAQLHSTEPVSSLADTILGLWNERVQVQFWLYHASQRHSCMPMNLPSYQFEKTQHWLPYIDRHSVAECEKRVQLPSPRESVDLVSLVGSTGPKDETAFEFSINQHSDEYALFVRGRSVFGHILAPGSVYAESAARAFRLLPTHDESAGLSSVPVELSHMKLHAPFGLDLQKRLRLTLRRHTATSWDFMVESHSLDHDSSKSSRLQASGTIRLQAQESLHFGGGQTLLRRLYDRCDELREDRNGSIVQGAYVKKLMSRVASYDDKYFGIRLIASRGLEAVAHVEDLPVVSQCRTGAALSPPLFDNFLLVAEMHAGSLGDLADDHLYICGGFDKIVPHAPSRNPESHPEGPWKVLSTLERGHDKTVVCDILVFNARDKTLSLSIIGARLRQIPVKSVQKVLEEINTTEPSKAENELRGMDKLLQLGSWGVAPHLSFMNSPAGLDNAEEATLGVVDYLHPGFSNNNTQFGLHSALAPPYGSTTSLSQLSSTDDTKDSLSVSPKPPASSTSLATSEHDQNIAALYDLLAEHLECSNGIPPNMPLGDIGLDSLVAIQIRSDLEKLFGKSPKLQDIDERTTFSDLCGMVLPQDPSTHLKLKASTGNPLNATTSNGIHGIHHISASTAPIIEPGSVLTQDPSNFLSLAVREFSRVKKETSVFAQQTGFAGFYPSVHQKQSLLVSTYILEAFGALGCDVKSLQTGDPFPTFSYLPKHQKLVCRLHEILEEAGIISPPDGQLCRHRTDAPLAPARPSAELYHDILVEHPGYQPDHQLLNVTAPRLADCLSGRADPLQLLFQDKAALNLLEDVYVSSPMFSTGNKMLGEMLLGLFSNHQFRRGGTERLRILEIGAGTGATTRRILDQLLECDVEFTYTFTDISLALVNGSRKKLSTIYGRQRVEANMEFMALDIEKPPPADMLQSYHLVVSSNCIHATQNLQQSCTNIEKLIRKEDGMLCLLELTRPLGWLDCVFGLLDGWWRFTDGRTYALAHENDWKAKLESAGFKNVDWTDDGSRESQHFRLITAWH
ncbi:citrinin polyketide synthase [Colletotrichum spaethianum]|uniref:Citrinin polyketide synthase n=1 Tax=Colletotrichum spaethianum TaxID=700344 RepID=A0AA37LIH8_9PEZI|nr:citrinin polyketide synthase [Colletotrichum spaethianum]GKT46889.1 citrinin polyketide synthase [Colletotrichum spaethianum]